MQPQTVRADSWTDAYCAKSAKSFLKLASCIFRKSGYSGFICPTGTSCLQSPKHSSLFLSKWSVCGQQKKSKMDDLLLIFKKQYEKIIQNFCHHSVVLIPYKICKTSLFFPFTVFVHTTVVNGVQNYITVKNKNNSTVYAKNTRLISKLDFPESHTGLEQEGDRIMTELHL